MPSYNKLSVSPSYILRIILLLVGTVVILYFGSGLLLPLIVAGFFSVILLNPLNKMLSWGFPEWLALTLSVFLFSIIMIVITALTTWQFNNIAQDWPEIQEKGKEKYEMIKDWSENQFGINLFEYFSNKGVIVKQMKEYVGVLASSFTNTLAQMLLIFVYIIFLLMQRRTFKKFLYKSVPQDRHDTLSKIVEEARVSISKYIYGKGVIIVILLTVYYIGFLIGNVPYAFFLALFASLFSIIPYVGNVIGGGAAVVLATLYSGFNGGIIVVVVMAVSQLVESYVLTPLIIGDQIDLNPFMTIFGIVAFSSLWGVVGAIIALPLLGVIKVVIARIEGFENYKILLEKDEET